MRIETERLLISELTEEMAEAVYLNSQDEDTRRFVPDEVFESVGQARRVVTDLIAAYRGTDGPFVYPVLTKAGDNIGYVQMAAVDSGWELGYHIAAKYTGKGYATEAVRAFLPVIAQQMGLREIYGICLSENRASARVMEKCGFVRLYTGEGNYQGEVREIIRNVWRAE